MAITAVANVTGVGGNLINVVLNGGPALGQVLAVTSVVGNTVSIDLATSGAGVVTSTENDLVVLMNGSAPILALMNSIVTNNPAAVIPNFAGTQTFFFGGGSGGTGGGYAGLDPGQFKILLLDTNQVQISNIPLLFSNLIHVPRNAPNLTNTNHANSIPANFWPTPPMMYRVNSSIRFLIYMTSSTPLGAPVTWELMFSGVRRYPCR